MPGAPATVKVVGVTTETWKQFQDFFSSKGCPGFCWCAAYRFFDAPKMSRDQKKSAMHRRVKRGVPVGVVALRDEQAVGWCSIAPRASMERLETSKNMPVVNDKAWTLLCLFVRRADRGEGLGHALIEGALRYARKHRVREVEAYPCDTAGMRKNAKGDDPSMHFGHSAMFKACGFEREGRTRRWVKKLRA